MSNDGFNFDAERQATNQALAGKLARLQSLTSADLATLLPDPGDQQEIQSLIAAVNAASSHNQKLAVLQKTLAAGGGALVGLLDRLT